MSAFEEVVVVTKVLIYGSSGGIGSATGQIIGVDGGRSTLRTKG